MENSFDVIIPVAGKDANFVHKVTYHIREHLLGAEIIYIITNKKYFKKIEHSLKNQRDIIIIDENNLVEDLTFDHLKNLIKNYTTSTSPGWFFQQFLKYGFALTKYAKQYYLSWDADTIPISDIHFFESGQPLFTRKYEYNDNYFKTIEKIIGLKKTVSYSFIAEHMLFNSEIVKELLAVISRCNVPGNTWFEKIIRAGDYKHAYPPFSEFETYGTYVTTTYPELYKTRQLNTFRRGGLIRGRLISDKMLKRLSIDIDTISFEMRDEPPFPYNIPNKLWFLKDLLRKISLQSPNVIIRKVYNKFRKHQK